MIPRRGPDTARAGYVVVERVERLQGLADVNDVKDAANSDVGHTTLPTAPGSLRHGSMLTQK
jgi:hypothetical protein